MFGLIAGLSAMFVTGACIGVGMTALCNASSTLDNMGGKLEYEKNAGYFNREAHRYGNNPDKRK